MILRPQGNFIGNGVLRGTITAYDDFGEPLGWELYGNWSSLKFREKAASDLAANTGINSEKAQAMLAQMLKTARKEADTASEQIDVSHKTEMRASFPGLVDVVGLDDGRLAFLLMDNGNLVTRLEWNEDNIVYIPPAPEHLPYLVPHESGVRLAFLKDTDRASFHDLLVWHKRASKLADDHHYQLVVLYDFHTYLADQSDYSPYLVFQTIDSERGKTRQGCSIAWVSYRGIVTETLQEANLFRWADSLGCTLFFDVKDIWKKAEKRGAEDILLGRFQRHGPKVARTLDPQAGPFKGVVYFSVYGPTVLAVNEPLREPLLSRSIIIIPPEATGKYPNLYPEEGLPLKERLVAFRARWMGKPLPPVAKPVDGRLGDILQPLGQIASLIGGEIKEAFPALAESLAQERMIERAESVEARITLAIEKASEEQVEGKVSTSTVTAAYNLGLNEKKQLTEESIGRRLKSLGFIRDRLPGGERGWQYKAELVAALRRKFGIDLVEKRGSPEPSKPPEPPKLASAQSYDSYLADSASDMTDSDNCQLSANGKTDQKQPQNDVPVTVVTVVTDKGNPSRKINVKPIHPCYACKEMNWWQRPDGNWVCGTCHPKPGDSNG